MWDGRSTTAARIVCDARVGMLCVCIDVDVVVDRLIDVWIDRKMYR